MTTPALNANAIVEAEIKSRIEPIETVLDADILTYVGPIVDIAADMFKIALEDPDTKSHDRLAILLETNGGYVEEAERIVNIMRYHYETVDFVITSHAMSAGTVLAMSGDDIYMDYSSMLGPIDPQIDRPGTNGFVPALGYLEQFDRLIERSANGTLTSAELAYLIEKFDPAELYQFEQARDLSIALLEEWLVRYKFKNWTKTATQGIDVTDEMKADRAKEIARLLNDTSRWHSHSRGISLHHARTELKLQILDVADSPNLQQHLTAFTELLYDYRSKRRHDVLMVSRTGYYGLEGR